MLTSIVLQNDSLLLFGRKNSLNLVSDFLSPSPKLQTGDYVPLPFSATPFNPYPLQPPFSFFTNISKRYFGIFISLIALGPEQVP